MHIPILAALDHEWTLLAQDSAANARFRLWKEQYPALASIDDLPGLLAVANDRSDLGAGDSVLAALAHQAPADAVAAQVLLHALLPGLKSIIRTCRPWRGADDLASEVITVALERIRCYPFDRRPSASPPTCCGTSASTSGGNSTGSVVRRTRPSPACRP
jgi:hypothetical protein